MANWGTCPKCGYEGHNKVYHWGIGEIECDECGYDYTKEEEAEAKKGGDAMSIFPWQKDTWEKKPKEKESCYRDLTLYLMTQDLERRKKERESDLERREQRIQKREAPTKETSFFSKKYVVYQDNKKSLYIENLTINNNYYGDERD